MRLRTDAGVVMVRCPLEAKPGDTIAVSIGGQTFRVSVPAGVMPGSEFPIQMQPAPAPQPAAAAAALPRAMLDTGFPEWKCQTAMEQCEHDATRAINFLYDHADKPDSWWQAFRRPMEGEPPQAVGGAVLPEAAAGGGPPLELSESVRTLIQRSDAFNSGLAYPRHPLATQRVATLLADPPPGVGREEFARQVDEHIAGVRPVADARVHHLLGEFLRIKRTTGSSIEKELYADMDANGLVDRLLHRRPLVFCESSDQYLLRSGQRGRGGFDSIGTSADTGAGPLTLRELQSYDEMCLSALVGMSVPTHFINEGGRRNNGVVGAPASYTKRGILIGLAGARFERPGLMEWQHMYITPEQNTAENGYGPRAGGRSPHDSTLLEMWARFYGLPHLPTFDEASAGPADLYCKVGHASFLNVRVYKERMRAVLLPFLMDAQERAAEQGKEAYCHMVGLGLGVWMVTEQQGVYLVEVVGELLANLELPDIGTVDFSWFPSACAQRGCNAAKHGQLAKCAGGHEVRIRFSKRDPAAKLSASDSVDQFKEPLLVAMYAWDSNSFPGNEYWLAPTQGMGCLSASGDPAAAACSTIAELQNPDILPDRICATAMAWYGHGDPPAPGPPPAAQSPRGGGAPAVGPLPDLQHDQVKWQHAAIDAARDGHWDLLQSLVLPPGGLRLMPDHLLNSIPAPRSFNVLHQMAMMRGDGSDGGEAASVLLELFLKAGCRFDLSVRSTPSAGPIAAFATDGMEAQVPGAGLTAREIATYAGSHHMLRVLDMIPEYSTEDSGAGLTKSVSLQGGHHGGYGSGGKRPGGGGGSHRYI